MNNIRRRLLSIICIIAYLIPAYGQRDTLTADGLYLKYNSACYQVSGVKPTIKELIKNKDIQVSIPNDSDMIRGELDRETKRIGLTYKHLPQYIISEQFGLRYPPNPLELLKTVGNAITSQWIHKDGECILFLKCGGITPSPNKAVNDLPKAHFNYIKHVLKIGPFLTYYPTEKEMQRIKKKITIWSPEKAKETVNAQYVITYPIKSKKSVYMGKYIHKLDLMMIKWGERLTVSFLVTKKGNKNIEKYIKDVEDAFWFED